MSDLPSVSVVIPAKNESRWLPACLQSMLEIDYPEGLLEVIVVDNGSTDSTVAIAQDFKAQVHLCPDLSISGLRNYGAEIAKGSVIAFVDADVAVKPMWLQNSLRCLLQEADIGCAGAFPEVPDDYGWVAQSWGRLQVPAGSERQRRVEWLPSMNMFVRKEAFERVQGFNTALTTCEDVDFCYRLGEHYAIVYCPGAAAVHYGEPGSLWELFRKERWRGLSSYEGVRLHGLKRSEIPSLVLPVYNALLILCFFYGVLSFQILWIVGSLLLFFLPFALKSYRILPDLQGTPLVLGMSLCYVVYSLARMVSVLDWTTQKIKAVQ